MDSSYVRLIESARVTDKTREVLLQRSHDNSAVSDYDAKSFSPDAFLILRSALRQLIPQDDTEDFIDIAVAIDKQLSTSTGDGWRYAVLPPDVQSINMGLGLLDATAQRSHGEHFVSLSETLQVNLLTDVQDGSASWPELDGRRWFEELLAQATEVYVSHPGTLSKLGFSGFAFLPSWPKLGLNSALPWEPKAT